jgi:polyribonucleotide nucleotidyltransferase
MISDITAVPEIGKIYLGKVVRLAEFGAFVEIFPGTDGLLHVSEIAEHRVKEVKDELREGDQILVKVLSIEGNRIKLSRKAVLREQRAKLGLPEVDPNAAASPSRTPEQNAPEAGNIADDEEDFDDDEDADDEDADEPNFNRADTVPVPAGQPAGGRPSGPGGPGGNRRPGGRRRRGGRRPGQGGGGTPNAGSAQ